MANREVCLTRAYHFSAAHYLNSPHLSDKENERVYGKCGRISGHGHNYILKVTVKGPVDPKTGMVINIIDIDRIVKATVLLDFDHSNLNSVLKDSPILTSEVLAKETWKRLSPHFSHPYLYRIEIDETRKNGFKYFGDGDKH